MPRISFFHLMSFVRHDACTDISRFLCAICSKSPKYEAE